MKDLSVRMPDLPFGSEVDTPQPSAPDEAGSPYLRIAADLRAAITCGALNGGDHLPTVESLRGRYQVSAGTVARAFALLKNDGLIRVSRGKRATVEP
ncbi:winged helix-turn-helix domain-containing protein [Pseudonocardia benzenivorans]